MVLSVYQIKRGEVNGGEYKLNTEELGNGDERMLRAFIRHNEKLIKKLKEDDGDIKLINKYRENIKIHEKQLEELKK
jgi:hypothetical protein